MKMPSTRRLGFEIVQPDSSGWRSFLGEHRHSIFHEPLWARVLADGLSGRPFCILLTDGGTPVAGMTGIELRILWTRQLYFSLPYGGLVGQAPDGNELARVLGEVARERDASRVRVVDWPGLALPTIQNATPFEDHTHILEFGGLTYEELWMGFKKNIRRDVRKALRNNISVVEVKNDFGVQAFYELYLASMERNKTIPKYGPEFVRAFFRHLVPASKGAIFLAQIGERPIAGMAVANSARMSHYLMGGSISETLGLCPNDLLINHAIRYALDKGLEAFDFLPSGPADLALQRFKTKWNAHPVQLNTQTINTKPISMALWNFALKMSHTPLFRRLLVIYRTRIQRHQGDVA